MPEQPKRPNALKRFFHLIFKRVRCKWGVDIDGDGVEDMGGEWDGEDHQTHANLQIQTSKA